MNPFPAADSSQLALLGLLSHFARSLDTRSSRRTRYGPEGPYPSRAATPLHASYAIYLNRKPVPLFHLCARPAW